MRMQFNRDSVGNRPTSSLAMEAVVRGIVAGIIFGVIMAITTGNAVVKGLIFGVLMGIFFFAYMLYLRRQPTRTGPA